MWKIYFSLLENRTPYRLESRDLWMLMSLSNRILYGYNSYFRKTQNSFSEYESDVAGCEALVSLLSNRIGHMMQAEDKIH